MLVLLFGVHMVTFMNEHQYSNFMVTFMNEHQYSNFMVTFINEHLPQIVYIKSYQFSDLK